ncbi:MAG TPA: CDP-alcohol phosphatidyltransferase family protein [Candidatus Sabulitectum sp.]|nr:CDP-alcohol phosphatidyltransferase family protein [Candidatus Sabulitectum sp.]
MISGRFLTAANMISLARIPLAAGAALSILSGQRLFTAVFMVTAALTDWLDGFMARKTGTVSDWGKILDPAADKIAFILAALALVRAGLLEAWVLWMLLARDGLIAAGGLLMSTRLKPPSSNIWGKAATTALALFMIRQALFPNLAWPRGGILPGADLLGTAAAGLIVVSFLTYAIVFIRTNWKRHATEKP